MIVFNIDVMLARRKMSLTELSERVGITMANLSILKTGKAKAVRVETLNKLCHALDCQPGDLLEYRPDEEACPYFGGMRIIFPTNAAPRRHRDIGNSCASYS